VIVFGGTVGNLSDHEGRKKHRRKVAERRGPHEQDSPALRVTRQLSYCAFHGYAFDHMEKPETIAAMQCPYRLTSEVAARLCTLAGLDTQDAIIQEIRSQDLLYAGILSDGWSRQHGGRRFIGSVIRTWSSDARLIERTFGLRVVDDLIESKEFVAADFERVVERVGIQDVITQIGTDTPTTQLAAVKIFNARRAAVGRPKVDGTPCLIHRAMLAFKEFEAKLCDDVPEWGALSRVTQIFNRSAVECFLTENGCRKTAIGQGNITRWLSKLKPARDIAKMAAGLDAFMEENPNHAVTEAWQALEFGTVKEYASVVGPLAAFARTVWEGPIKLYQTKQAVGMAATLYSFDDATRRSLQDPSFGGQELPNARPACRVALAKMDEIEKVHKRKPVDLAAAMLHPVTHKGMLKKLERRDVEAGTGYLVKLVERTPAATPQMEFEAPAIDTSDPLAMMMSQKPMATKRASFAPRPRAVRVPPPLKPAVDEVREKLESLKTVVIDQSLLGDFNLADYWTTRFRDVVASGESGRFERAAVALSASAVGNPRIESTFSEARFIINDHRMRMKPPTINSCLVLAENADLGEPLLLKVVQEWLLANEMGFRHLIYRPALIPIDDDRLPSCPADPQIAAALRFAIGRLEGDSLRPPLPEWARMTREELMTPPGSDDLPEPA
jgi:hypothetical protein